MKCKIIHAVETVWVNVPETNLVLLINAARETCYGPESICLEPGGAPRHNQSRAFCQHMKMMTL